MTGHDPDDAGDDPDRGGDTPRDSGDDADATPADDRERPDGLPDDWTTADEVADRDDPDASDGADAPDATARGDAEGAAASTLGADRDPEKPPAPNADGDGGPTISEDGALTWFMNTNHGGVVVVRDVLSSVAAVAAIGLVLFAVSGIWPPLVAVESGSMEPHMSKGDLVFIVDEQRYAPQSAVGDTGVSTHQSASAARGYSKFGNHGDVVVFRPDGETYSTPIIHRARFHVEKDEKWVEDANPEYLGNVDSCSDLSDDVCPAPHDGFITKGDANPTYDQIGDQSTVVKSEWIRGKAQLRIPLLGWIRLQFAKLAAVGPTGFGALLGRFGALGLAGGAAVASARL